MRYCVSHVMHMYIATAPWKAVDVTEEVDGESLWSVATSQGFESLEWNTGCARHKLRRMYTLILHLHIMNMLLIHDLKIVHYGS